ncbi:DUF1573 domain-containing protein [Termitidicoccus mucosus]
MKKSGILLWCTVVCALCASPLPAQLTWTTTRIELTSQPGDATLTASYPFANRTNATINILDIHAACGCTTPELEKKTYAPGEKGEVKVTFTIGSRQGSQTKTITLRTDAGDTILQFVATIPQRLQISPRLVIFRPGDDTPRHIQLSFRTDIPVTDVTLSDPGSAFTVRLAEDQPGTDYTLAVAPADHGEALTTLVIRSKGASGVTYTDTVFFRRMASR